LEIMIVVVIIGLLAGMGLPALKRAQRALRMTRYISDLRVFFAGLRAIRARNRHLATDRRRGRGAGQHDHRTPNFRVDHRQQHRGRWNYDYNIAGVTAAISTTTTLADAEMTLIDGKIDDGDLTAGHFRELTNGRFAWILQE
jgi:type II secretory pathway pseudopilin PulG